MADYCSKHFVTEIKMGNIKSIHGLDLEHSFHFLFLFPFYFITSYLFTWSNLKKDGCLKYFKKWKLFDIRVTAAPCQETFEGATVNIASLDSRERRCTDGPWGTHNLRGFPICIWKRKRNNMGKCRTIFQLPSSQWLLWHTSPRREELEIKSMLIFQSPIVYNSLFVSRKAGETKKKWNRKVLFVQVSD